MRHRLHRHRLTTWAPAEWACAAILGIVILTLAVAQAAGAQVTSALVGHIALLALFGAATAALSRFADGGWVAIARSFLVIGVMFALYITLAWVPFVTIPWLADPALAAIDRALFLSRSPNLWIDARLTGFSVELLSFAYILFIPYLYLSILVGILGRPEGERDELVTGLALLYASSFLGYLFVPARGPIVELASVFPEPLNGGYFHALVVDSIERVGGPHGAFPSLHVGVTIYAVGFDLDRNRLRGLIYLPLAVLIAVATVALRYHYVVDLIAAAVLAAAVVRVRSPLLKQWRQARGAR